MLNIPRRRLIGVLGGMGPAATIDFLSKMVAATPADFDQEHVPTIVHNVPQIPDRSAAIERGSDEPWLPILAGVRMLERAGVEIVAVPCNAAHYWYDRLARASSVHVVHIADAVRSVIEERQTKMGRLALLATRDTVLGRIYHDRLAGVAELLIPEESTQRLLDRTIAAVKANDLTNATALAEAAAEQALACGADQLLLACTELPIAFRGSRYLGHCLDATQALAQLCVQMSFGTCKAQRMRVDISN